MNLIAVSKDSAELKRLNNILHEIKDVVYLRGFSDTMEALKYIHDADIVIVDTNITEDATYFAKKVYSIDEDINIVFMSDERRHAIDAFNVDAIDYILKPCTKDRLLKSIRRAKELDGLIQSGCAIPDILQNADISLIYNTLPENIRIRSERIATYSSKLMRHALDVRIYSNDIGLSEEVYNNIFEIVKLHDIGKSCFLHEINDTTKKGRLHLQKHTEYGMQILEDYMDYAFGNILDMTTVNQNDLARANLYYMAMETARSHHERWDGRGYPGGLEGESIPVIARICAICSTYDTLTHYNKLSHKYTCTEIQKAAGALFDPVLAGQFLSSLNILK